MITVLDTPVQLPSQLGFLAGPFGSFLANLIVWLLVAAAAYILLSYVLRAMTRRWPGDWDDAVLSAVRRPMVVLLLVIGMSQSLAALGLTGILAQLVERGFRTGLIIAVAWMAMRLSAGVLIPMLQVRAARTEKRFDDVMVGIARMIVPLIVLFFATLGVLSQWDVDIAAALAGAGIISLVLGLALQDTLQNVFSGIGLLADEPFTPGELIELPDGRLCKVEKIGLRTTQLYYVNEHSMIFIPNRELSNAAIVNVMKPTYDARATVEVGVAYASDIARVSAVLLAVTREHPNVLLSAIPERMAALAAVIARVDAGLTEPATAPAARDELAGRRAALTAQLPRLERELELDGALTALDRGLASLAIELNRLESGGFSPVELDRLRRDFLPAITDSVRAVASATSAWASQPDPWALAEEAEADRARFEAAAALLDQKWSALSRAVSRPPSDIEMELDQRAAQLRAWLRTSLKTAAEPWKDPHVLVKAFGASSVDLVLEYYVDDVRLEHFERPRRVATELMMEIHERFKQHNIEIPFPQTDLWIRSTPIVVKTQTLGVS